MQLTRNAKGTIGFTIAVVSGQIWSAVSPVYQPPWEPWPPIIPFMVEYAVPFMVNYYRPVLIGLAGLVVLLVWEDRPAGYLVALVLAAIATVFGVSVTIFDTMNREWLGLFTAVTAVAFPRSWLSGTRSEVTAAMVQENNRYLSIDVRNILHETYGRRSMAHDSAGRDTWPATIAPTV